MSQYFSDKRSKDRLKANGNNKLRPSTSKGVDQVHKTTLNGLGSGSKGQPIAIDEAMEDISTTYPQGSDDPMDLLSSLEVKNQTEPHPFTTAASSKPHEDGEAYRRLKEQLESGMRQSSDVRELIDLSSNDREDEISEFDDHEQSDRVLSHFIPTQTSSRRPSPARSACVPNNVSEKKRLYETLNHNSQKLGMSAPIVEVDFKNQGLGVKNRMRGKSKVVSAMITSMTSKRSLIYN